MSQIPPTMPGATSMKPHRGVIVLVLGILGIVLCVICGIIAWVMGNADLREMDAGLMDPSGRSLTKVGKILGMISVGLILLYIIIWVVMMVLGLAVGAAGAAAGAGANP